MYQSIVKNMNKTNGRNRLFQLNEEMIYPALLDRLVSFTTSQENYSMIKYSIVTSIAHKNCQ